MIKAIVKQFFILGLLVVLLAACSSTPPTKQVTLIARDIEWNMDTITAEVGQTVELTVRNEGALDHNLVIADLDIDLLLSPGSEQTVSFTVDEAGTIDYICNIPGHEEAGMAGQIVIGGDE